MRFSSTLLALLALSSGCASPPVKDSPPLDLQFLHWLGDSSTFIAPQFAALAPGGTFAVSDGRDLRVHIFDTTGRRTAQVGGRGEAPGEFRSITALEWREAGFWVSDGTQLRLSTFDPTGHLRRAWAFTPPPSSLPGVRWLTPLGFLAESLEVLGYSQAAHSGGATPPLLMTVAGRVVDSIALPPTVPLFFNVDLPGDFHLSAIQPFRGVSHSIGQGAAGLLVAHEPNPGRLQLTVIRAPGDTTRSQTLQVPVVPLTPATVERWIDQTFGAQSPIPRAMLADSVRAHIHRPKYLPSASSLYLATDGEIWVRGADTLAGSVPWHLITPAGAPGLLRLQATDRVLWAHGDSVLLSQDTDIGPRVGLFLVQSHATAR